jgi:hypothetical protein
VSVCVCCARLTLDAQLMSLVNNFKSIGSYLILVLRKVVTTEKKISAYTIYPDISLCSAGITAIICIHSICFLNNLFLSQQFLGDRASHHVIAFLCRILHVIYSIRSLYCVVKWVMQESNLPCLSDWFTANCPTLEHITLASSFVTHAQVRLAGHYLVPLRGGLDWHK